MHWKAACVIPEKTDAQHASSPANWKGDGGGEERGGGGNPLSVLEFLREMKNKRKRRVTDDGWQMMDGRWQMKKLLRSTIPTSSFSSDGRRKSLV